MNLQEFLTPSFLFFGALAGLSALTAIGVVAFADPVRSGICLVANFLVLAVMYFTLSAQLMGIVQVIVYAGAIMVLFLFVVMLLMTTGANPLKESRDLKRLLGGALGIGLFAVVVSQVIVPLMTVTQAKMPEELGRPESVGRALLTDYVYPFEAAGVLLLVGVVGSILLAKRKI